MPTSTPDLTPSSADWTISQDGTDPFGGLLVDRAAHEELDAKACFGGERSGFLRLQQPAAENLLGAR